MMWTNNACVLMLTRIAHPRQRGSRSPTEAFPSRNARSTLRIEVSDSRMDTHPKLAPAGREHAHALTKISRGILAVSMTQIFAMKGDSYLAHDEKTLKTHSA